MYIYIYIYIYTYNIHMYIYKIGLRQNYLHKYDTLRRSKQETTSFEKFNRVLLFMCIPLNVLCRVLLFHP